MTSNTFPVDVALVHFPVQNKEGLTIGSALTNFDLHDIARAGKTYGIGNVYIVTPYQDQQHLAAELLAHWTVGYGAKKNYMRKDALSIVEICGDLASLYERVTTKRGARPTILATCAKNRMPSFSYEHVRRDIFAGHAYMILFGTAWGLADEVLQDVDAFLPPLRGFGNYNHLSVRSAAAIILDRLVGVHDLMDENIDIHEPYGVK